jgi:hypothetical protein
VCSRTCIATAFLEMIYHLLFERLQFLGSLNQGILVFQLFLPLLCDAIHLLGGDLC